MLSAIFVTSAAAAILPTEDAVRFKTYTRQFNKTYSNVEFADRMDVFLRAEERIAQLNAARTESHHATFGWTEYTDWTSDEFQARLGFKRSASVDREAIPVYQSPKEAEAAQSIDWRAYGKVTAVKDQGQCGSCWAFSAVESVESGALMQNTPNDETPLSPQQVTSCDTRDGGCNGGDLPSALEYIQSVGGLDSNAAYPYTSGTTEQTGTCTDPRQYVSQTDPAKWTYGCPPCQYGSCAGQDENALAASLLANGPHGICLDAENWQNYQGGVMTPSQCGGSAAGDLDHCVQLVGMEVTNGNNYWIVRNSWNTWWGDAGYIYLEKGSNTCGVANEALYVTVN